MTPREQRQLGDGEDAKPRHGFQAIGVDERSRLHCRIRPGYGPPMLWGARLLTLPVAAVLLCAAAPRVPDCSWQVGENIAWGRGKRSSPAAIVDAWMHSPPHRELILTGSIKDVGVGIKRGRPGDGKAKAGTYTADFGTKN